VGVSAVDGELVGDVDFEAALGVAGLLTPHRRELIVGLDKLIGL